MVTGGTDRRDTPTTDEQRQEAEMRTYLDCMPCFAQQALDNKLIDGIGYLDDVINISKRATGLAEARVITYHRHTDYPSYLRYMKHWRLRS